MNHSGNHDTLTARAPSRGDHVRAMNYLRGSVAAGTHSWAAFTFTGIVKGTTRDGAPWVAINLDRDPTVSEHAALIDAEARVLFADRTRTLIIPEHTLDSWTFELLAERDQPASPLITGLITGLTGQGKTAYRPEHEAARAAVDQVPDSPTIILVLEEAEAADDLSELLRKGRKTGIASPESELPRLWQYATPKEFVHALMREVVARETGSQS